MARWGITDDAVRILKALRILNASRSRSDDSHERLGYFEARAILLEAGALGRDTPWDAFRNSDGWQRWYAAFSELRKVGYILATVAAGMHVGTVSIEAEGLSVAEQLSRSPWSKLGAAIAGDLRHVLVSMIASIVTAVLTVVVLNALGLVSGTD